jgi:hypothetical protein
VNRRQHHRSCQICYDTPCVLMWTLSISGPSIIPKLLLNMINAGSRLCA